MLRLILRFTGALFLFLLCWASGCAYSWRAVLHLRELTAVTRLIDRIAEEIEYRCAPIDDIFSELQHEPELSLLAPNVDSFHTICAPKEFLPAEQRLFTECFSGLGHGSCEEECRRLAYYRECFFRFAADAAERAKQAQKIYPRLGIGLGAMLAILTV